MIKEFGMDPNAPGLEIMETLIEEDLRYNPECPCRARTCPQHGFCKYCVEHHKQVLAVLASNPGANKMPPPLKDGEYELDHGKPYCWRMPSERIAKLMEGKR